jgi:predicted nucleic acid-binding protein
MGAFGAICLDTNVFIMAFEMRSEVSDQLTQIFDRLDGQPEARLVTSELTLSELLVRPIRENDAQRVEQYEAFIAQSRWLNVLPVARSTLYVAATLRAQISNLKLPDAIHIATALGTSCSHILTSDNGIRGIYSLHKGAQLAEPDPKPLTVIRPDAPTLSSILQSLAA